MGVDPGIDPRIGQLFSNAGAVASGLTRDDEHLAYGACFDGVVGGGDVV